MDPRDPLGIGGVAFLLVQLRRRPATPSSAAPLSDEEQARLQSLLDADRNK